MFYFFKMETVSDACRTDSAEFTQIKDAGRDRSSSASENGVAEDEENLDIDEIEDCKGSAREPAIISGRGDGDDAKDKSDDASTVSDDTGQRHSSGNRGDLDGDVSRDVTEAPVYTERNNNNNNNHNNNNNNDSNNRDNELMGDEYDEIDDVEEEAGGDEDVDDDDEYNDSGLVVNMEVTDTPVKPAPSSSASASPPPARVSPLAVPRITKSQPSPTATTALSPFSLSSSSSPSSVMTFKSNSIRSEIPAPLASLGNGLAKQANESAHLLDGIAAKRVLAPGNSTSNARSLPIHCVIEQMQAEADCKSENGVPGSHIVLDTYAILPGNTHFSDLVRAALLRLGYSPGEATGAKGGLQLKNWKTLNFESVTDNAEATVEEILGEITSVATLKVQLSSPVRSSGSDDVKEKLLQLLLTKSKDFLVQTGCPIEESLLDAISTGEISQSISDQVCSSFNDWYRQQKDNHASLSVPAATRSPLTSVSSSRAEMTTATAVSPGRRVVSSPHAQSYLTDSRNNLTVPGGRPNSVSTSPASSHLDVRAEHAVMKYENPSELLRKSQDTKSHNKPFQSHPDTMGLGGNKTNLGKTQDKNSLAADLYKLSRSPDESNNIPSTLQSHQSNPYLGLMPGKTRIRTSFDPEHEIPRLQKWFTDNQHPTREQMMRFMHELNGLESRKGRRPLDLTNIIYWFKNARAAQRRASKALDDSFENEENVDMNSTGSGASTTESMPPYLPNKNAVYMIPFHPYPHLIPGGGGGGGNGGTGVTSGAGVDEPYDLSLTKRPVSEMSKTHNGRDRGENLSMSHSTSPSPTKSSPSSSECESHGETNRKKKSECPPRFPALLDAASKMRQEIPLRSDNTYYNGNHNTNGSYNGGRGSPPYRSGSGSSDVEHSTKNDDTENNLPSPTTPLQNGIGSVDQYSMALKIKHEDGDYLGQQNSKKSYRRSSHASRDSGLELGQVKKEDDVKANSSEEDNTSESYDSEEELKLRMKQNAAAAVVDYASAMHNNVSRLTAANMAALSLAQMGQPLHIPQLTPSLAMAYYPMDPRFYSQPTVPHSLSSSPPTSLATTHASHLPQLSLRQPQDANSHMESRSPLPSPSSMQQSINQLNHQHHHHQHHQQPSPQPQQHHHRHHSEPRKRRTRVFIDPLTEIPKLEKWFTEDTHPSAFMIDKYCEELNKCEYRHKFPKLEPKNVQLWFKNHRAKVKRMKLCDGQVGNEGCQDDDLDD